MVQPTAGAGVALGSRMTYPAFSWLHPTPRSTHRGILHRSPTDSILVWEAHPVGADDFDHRGIPLAPGSWVLVWLGGAACDQTPHDTIDAAKMHAAAVLVAKGWAL